MLGMIGQWLMASLMISVRVAWKRSLGMLLSSLGKEGTTHVGSEMDVISPPLITVLATQMLVRWTWLRCSMLGPKGLRVLLLPESGMNWIVSFTSAAWTVSQTFQPKYLLVCKIVDLLLAWEPWDFFCCCCGAMWFRKKVLLWCSLVAKCITVSPLQSHTTSPPSQYLGLPLVSNCHT